MLTLTMYSRAGCHLCDDMKALVDRVVRTHGQALSIEEIDISTDPALESRYGLEIPVLMLNGRKIAKYRIGEAELVRVLAGAAADGAGGAGGSG